MGPQPGPSATGQWEGFLGVVIKPWSLLIFSTLWLALARVIGIKHTLLFLAFWIFHNLAQAPQNRNIKSTRLAIRTVKCQIPAPNGLRQVWALITLLKKNEDKNNGIVYILEFLQNKLYRMYVKVICSREVLDTWDELCIMLLTLSCLSFHFKSNSLMTMLFSSLAPPLVTSIPSVLPAPSTYTHISLLKKTLQYSVLDHLSCLLYFI